MLIHSPGKDPGLVEGHHGQALPRPVPQEQDPQGQAHEDPKEPKVNRVSNSQVFFSVSQ